MGISVEKISQDVTELSRHERLALMRILLELDRPLAADGVEETWDAEIRTRIKAVDEHRSSGIPYNKIKQDMGHRFGSR